MPVIPEITYQDKSNNNPIVNRQKQATAEDFNEIKSVVNGIGSILNDVVNPLIHPTFIAPSLAVTFTVAELHIVGSTISFGATASFDRGEIQIDGVKQNDRSGAPTDITVTADADIIDGGIDLGGGYFGIIGDGTNDENVVAVTNYVVAQGDRNFLCQVTYLAGPQPLNSRGDIDGAPLGAGMIETPKVMRGVFPFFANFNAINTFEMIPTLYNDDGGNNIEIDFPAENDVDKQRFAIHKETWNDVRGLNGIQQWDTETQTWYYPGGSAGSSLGYWNVTDDQIDVNGDRNYKIFTHNQEKRGAVRIRLIF